MSSGSDDPLAIHRRLDALGDEIAERGRVARHGELLALIAELARDRVSGVDHARKLLSKLRNVRAFDSLHIAAADMVERGLATPFSNRMKVQALIELERHEEAFAEIGRARKIGKDAAEMMELSGLEGRIWKQRFVRSVEAEAADMAALKSAVTAYDLGWKQSKKASAWHGVNMVALLTRASVDGRTVIDAAKVRSLAVEVKQAALAEKAKGYGWADASLGEVALALGDYELANEAYGAYLKATTDEFALASTRRQLDEIWVRAKTVPDAWQALRDKATWALMSAEKGQVQLEQGELSALAERLQDDRQGYQGLFGSRPVPIEWAIRMIEVGKCIGRIERRGAFADPQGTGFVMDATLFSPKWNEYGRVLVTNEHVISPHGSGQLRPEEAVVRFSQASPEQSFKLGPVLWCSRKEHHDVTILAIDGLPGGAGSLAELAPFKRLEDQDRKPETRERVTVMGHPAGSDRLHLGIENLEVEDLDYARPTAEPERVWYKRPTLGGNSGSPVLTWQKLEAAAVHHREIRARGCNEGISLESIREAIEAKPEGWDAPIRSVAATA